MSELSAISEILPYYGNKKLLVKDHNTDDIVRCIKNAHKKYAKDYDQISDRFWKGDAETTARYLFKFNRNHVIYDVESPVNQAVKSPGAIIWQQHGDCKHYATFINGICNSLERKGHPIRCYYRFVSDLPDREVHHVFAVIEGEGHDYWVDPVLTRFDSRPQFHNVKDVHMPIYEICATSAGRPGDLPMVGRPGDLPMVGKKKAGGKKKKTNIFKKLGADVKKVAHGAEVNVKNAAKGAKNLVLKVSMAPARGSFLALVDLNAFNLATRLADTWNAGGSKKNALVKKWKDIGGDENGLKNAIYNGIKHKAAVHHQAPAKHLSGVGLVHMRHPRYPGRVFQVYHRGYQAPNIHAAYSHPPDDLGNHPRVPGIGVVVAIPALLALASALIAVLKPYLKPDAKADAEMVKGGKKGVSDMVQNASDAIDAQNGEGPGGGGKHHKAKGGTMDQDVASGDTPSMVMSTGTDPETGDPTIQVHAVDHPQINNAGKIIPGGSTSLIDPNAPDPGSAGEAEGPDPTNPNALINVPKNVGTDFMRDVIGPIKDQVRQIWAGYKVPIMVGVAGFGMYKFATRKKKKRR